MKLPATLQGLASLRHGKELRRRAEILASGASSLLRGLAGYSLGELGARPEKRLVLYELENCPHSRRVREALSMLDLDVDVRPCPMGETRHRAELRSIGGKEQIPMLVDPNTMDVLYEADAIVEYLFRTYGHGKVDLRLRSSAISTWMSRRVSRLRGSVSTYYQESKRPELPLELWSYEASAEARLVRETLARFGIPYALHNAAHGSGKLRQISERAPHTAERVPTLYDPNRDVWCTGAGNCVGHVRDTYGKRTPGDVTVSTPFDAEQSSYLHANPLVVIP